MLSAHLRAQADALAHGTGDDKLPPHKQYPGNRPSSVLYVDKTSPRNLGRLIALYEHKVFTQGVLWNINSFDQFGVELGKELARKIDEGEKQWTRKRFNLSIRKFLKMVGSTRSARSSRRSAAPCRAAVARQRDHPR